MLSCSFCGVNQDAAATLLAGPDVNICDRCVRIGVRVIATRDALERPPARQADWADTDDEALLSAAAATAELVDKVREDLQSQVSELRRRDVGWDAIGAALGLSRQVALERFA